MKPGVVRVLLILVSVFAFNLNAIGQSDLFIRAGYGFVPGTHIGLGYMFDGFAIDGSIASLWQPQSYRIYSGSFAYYYKNSKGRRAWFNKIGYTRVDNSYYPLVSTGVRSNEKAWGIQSRIMWFHTGRAIYMDNRWGVSPALGVAMFTYIADQQGVYIEPGYVIPSINVEVFYKLGKDSE